MLGSENNNFEEELKIKALARPIIEKRTNARSRITFVYNCNTDDFVTKMRTRKARLPLFVLP